MVKPLIYVGIKDLHHLARVPKAMVSVNRLERRKSPFEAQRWVLDSGAFTRITQGRGHLPVNQYVEYIERFQDCGHLEAVVAQDYMCEPVALAATGLSISDHQAKTTARYVALRELSPVPVIPVVQGWTADDYQRHAVELTQYVPRHAWVGVGSVCKRQGDPNQLATILEAIERVDPSWKLHGFGVKMTALRSARCWRLLHSLDSAAWSYESWFGSSPRLQRVEAALEWLERMEAIRPDPNYQTTLAFPAY